MKTKKPSRKPIQGKDRRAARAKPGKQPPVDWAWARALESTLVEWNSPEDEAAYAGL